MNFFKKCSPSFWIIVALISVAVFLFAIGFRITYSPALETVGQPLMLLVVGFLRLVP